LGFSASDRFIVGVNEKIWTILDFLMMSGAASDMESDILAQSTPGPASEKVKKHKPEGSRLCLSDRQKGKPVQHFLMDELNMTTQQKVMGKDRAIVSIWLTELIQLNREIKRRGATARQSGNCFKAQNIQ
jgi:hypothetical protein